MLPLFFAIRPKEIGRTDCAPTPRIPEDSLYLVPGICNSSSKY